MNEKPVIDSRWVISLQGKDYPTWPGILDLAHQLGLEAIDTELVQIPTQANEQTAIVKATTRLKGGRQCADYGDASPRNCSTKIATALIRLASTRAKGRALRDLCNVGQMLLEELPEEEAVAMARSSPAQPEPGAARPSGGSKTAEGGRGPAATATAGFEPLYHADGKSLHRTDLVAACLKDQQLARDYSIPVEPLDPATATNEQLFSYGRSLRPRLRAAKALRDSGKAAPQPAEVVT